MFPRIWDYFMANGQKFVDWIVSDFKSVYSLAALYHVLT